MIDLPDPCPQGLEQLHLMLYAGQFDGEPKTRAVAKEYLYLCHYSVVNPCPRAGWVPEPQGPRGAQPQDGRLFQHPTTQRVEIRR